MIWKTESLRDLKYCSFWAAITCDLISYAFTKKKKKKYKLFYVGEQNDSLNEPSPQGKNPYYHQSSERDSKKYAMRLDSEDLWAGKSPKFILQPSAKEDLMLDCAGRYEGCIAVAGDMEMCGAWGCSSLY